MPFPYEDQGQLTILRLEGRMDAVTAPEFDTIIEELVEKGRFRLLVDFSGLEYISSAGLRSLLLLARKMDGEDAKLVLCGLSGMVSEVFDIAGFAPMFNIQESVEAARGQFE